MDEAWTCPTCGTLVPSGSSHYCQASGGWFVQPPDLSGRVAALETRVAALENAAHERVTRRPAHVDLAGQDRAFVIRLESDIDRPAGRRLNVSISRDQVARCGGNRAMLERMLVDEAQGLIEVFLAGTLGDA